jgi:UPF0042 nucleotide-binding protein
MERKVATMKLVLLTGLSGAGKTQALKMLEDIGFFCVDNLPPIMIPSFLELCTDKPDIKEVAIVVDIRGGIFMEGIIEALASLERSDIDIDILYMEAAESVIVKRYKETRRSHPFEKDGDIIGSIALEQKALRPLRERATRTIDSSYMPVRELRQLLISLYRPEGTSRDINVNIISFGYKNGIPPEADLVFDARFLPNPYYIPEMKYKSGLDKVVYEYIESFDEARVFVDKLIDFFAYIFPFYMREGNSYPIIGIGCTGGRHRSVAISQMLEERLIAMGHKTAVKHRDIHVDEFYRNIN